MRPSTSWTLCAALVVALVTGAACSWSTPHQPAHQTALQPAQRTGPQARHHEPGSPTANDVATARAQTRRSAGAAAADQLAAQAKSAPRPGLGTGWGESRSSLVTEVPFQRAAAAPTASVAVKYDNLTGVLAATGAYRPLGRALFPVSGLDVQVQLLDGWGRPLAATCTGGQCVAVGEAGQRYTIAIHNRTPFRMEAVASVDGLDVLDGRPASTGRRGYLIGPHDTLEIEGWRRSASHVAAFRFSSVDHSYAARTGSDRNVGVIGVALFHEAGYAAGPGPDRDELWRRQTADPFPQGYAAPPRW